MRAGCQSDQQGRECLGRADVVSRAEGGPVKEDHVVSHSPASWWLPLPRMASASIATGRSFSVFVHCKLTGCCSTPPGMPLPACHARSIYDDKKTVVRTLALLC